ncbi:hypothetical protein MG293_014402 [Ovis ammon polii]|uniref:Uncharacterized protein n=1 Tax=Ovis ammon polii TaxID=230172 RepID=A0AAD4TXJ4_OVIAM|nr:hypothetical protein MG293_014402 [Ovis ammon polii]
MKERIEPNDVQAQYGVVSVVLWSFLTQNRTLQDARRPRSGQLRMTAPPCLPWQGLLWPPLKVLWTLAVTEVLPSRRLSASVSSVSQLRDTEKQRLKRERKSQSRSMLRPSLELLAGSLGDLVLMSRVLSEVPSGEQCSSWESLFLIHGVTGCQIPCAENAVLQLDLVSPSQHSLSESLLWAQSLR